jgi:hypothetical protein
MKLLSVRRWSDYGVGLSFGFLNIGRYCVLQGEGFLSDDTGWPYVQFSLGCGRLFSVLAWIGPFGIELELLARAWEK